ncbi:hypothetical protein B0A48_16543 [Cryoendolithus antarcticus]|uniref:SigF-like NTF2-like domain-containing protein n=1 Tax=Cryoendolithus antarcticus TaxID=1507870 RepID=A0A1V8SDZ7_9PEZI|nr:hypothetical protein B0A48_16543 [Cryoendolithus antarcticus]
MDDPTNDVSSLIHALTRGSPSEQQTAIQTYFTSSASFSHPFCRTGSFEGSRYLILKIYQWYKILSPKIELEIHSVAFDPKSLVIFVSLTQLFTPFLAPIFANRVDLDVKLRLIQHRHTGKYYITSQTDLYTIDQWVRFLIPWGIGTAMVCFLQFLATLGCVLGAWVGAPITWARERMTGQGQGTGRLGEMRENGIGKTAGKATGAIEHEAEKVEELVEEARRAALQADDERAEATGLELYGKMQFVTT